LAAGDQQESFYLAITSLNLAAKFHLPVILLSDKFIGESGASIPDLSQIKPKIIENNLSIPGKVGGEYMANSYEHDEQGFATEDVDIIKKNTLNRQKQLQKIVTSVPKPTFYFGSEKSTTLIVTWGSTKSTIWEALRILDNPDIMHLHFTTVWPINPETFKLFNKFKKIIVVENNSNAQFVSLLKSQFDFNPTQVILKSDGRPFFPEELIKTLKTL
jgi:2-oxoglutarate ferredoxin oxidoreductase subunit alpha